MASRRRSTASIRRLIESRKSSIRLFWDRFATTRVMIIGSAIWMKGCCHQATIRFYTRLVAIRGSGAHRALFVVMAWM